MFAVLLLFVSAASAQLVIPSLSGAAGMAANLHSSMNNAVDGQQVAQEGHGRLIGFGRQVAGNLGYLGDAVRTAFMDTHNAIDDHLEVGHERGLKEFGRRVGNTLSRVDPALERLWGGHQENIDKSIVNIFKQMKKFGSNVDGNIGHVQKQSLGAWNGFQSNVDKGIAAFIGSSPSSLSLPELSTKTPILTMTESDD